jgi:hypothetical protein
VRSAITLTVSCSLGYFQPRRQLAGTPGKVYTHYTEKCDARVIPKSAMPEDARASVGDPSHPGASLLRAGNAAIVERSLADPIAGGPNR